MKDKIFKFVPSLVIMAAFYALAVALWKTTGKAFFLANFIIIGTFLGLGFGLWPILKKQNRDIARRITLLLLGSYIFFGVGLGLIYPNFGNIRAENLQFEGFWFYLLWGGVAGCVIHYAIAKIVGPFIFGRTFCGWVCWTSAILDCLPWRNGKGRISGRWEYFRYVHFGISTAAVLMLVFAFNYTGLDTVRVKTDGYPGAGRLFETYAALKEFWWFLLGNCAYYSIAVLLAFMLKDNRAFCKYVCPITVFMKIGSRFSLLKIKTDREKCNQCRLCDKNCLMNIKISDYAKEGKRVSCSECIVCENCARVCPKGALRLSFGFDAGFADRIIRK